MSISVIVCDDHPIFRDGLKANLFQAFEACDVREVGHFRELRKALSSRVPNLLLLDIFLPGLEPEASISELSEAHPDMKIVIVSMLTKVSAIERFFRVGAKGFVSKTAPPGSLKKAVAEVIAGGRPLYLAPRKPGDNLQPGDNPTDFLPPRQAQVLHLLCLGMSNKEIAKELKLSASTVRAHVSALFSKIGVSNRTEAASYGIRYGILAYTGNHRYYTELLGASETGLSDDNIPPDTK